jgi:hypothetical protein
MIAQGRAGDFMLIHECPICGGELHASKTTYLSSVTIDEQGAMRRGFDAGLGSDVDIYCENDHDASEILETLKEKVV